MDHLTLYLILGAVLLALIAAVLLLRGRKQHVRLSDVSAPPPPPAPPSRAAPPAVAEVPPPAVPLTLLEPESEAAAVTAGAVAPAVPVAAPLGDGGDPLTQIKGLGPKAAARLAELGVTRFADIAGWSDADAARIDAAMGPFRGRIARDRWIEQARLLAAGDRDAFEAAFGKLGG